MIPGMPSRACSKLQPPLKQSLPRCVGLLTNPFACHALRGARLETGEPAESRIVLGIGSTPAEQPSVGRVGTTTNACV